MWLAIIFWNIGNTEATMEIDTFSAPSTEQSKFIGKPEAVNNVL